MYIKDFCYCQGNDNCMENFERKIAGKEIFREKSDDNNLLGY